MTRDLTTAEQDDGREDDGDSPLRAPAQRMPAGKRSAAGDPGQYLPLMARAAANKTRARKVPLSWSAALEAAPWSPTLPAAWESEFRRAYAERLVEMGTAKPAARGGQSGASGETLLEQKKVYATAKEFREQKRRAKVAGLSWSAWARRKLAAP